MIEISDDSEDTIIGEYANNSIDEILKKYCEGNATSVTITPSKSATCYKTELSDDEYDGIALPLAERLKFATKTDLNAPEVVELLDDSSNELPIITKKSNSFEYNLDDKETLDTSYTLSQLLSKYSTSASSTASSSTLVDKAKINTNKASKKLEKEAAKLLKAEERQKKKEAMEREKQAKNALREVAKSVSPDECIKSMTVKVDRNIIQEEYGNFLLDFLQKNDLKYKLDSKLIPNIISWSRKVKTLNNEKMINTIQEEEKHILLLMNLQTFLNHVQDKTLTAYVESIFSLIDAKQLTIGVYGLETYHKRNKSKNSANKKFTKRQINYAVAELVLHHTIYLRSVESYEEVAQLVFQCTKAVAQIPYKLKKQEMYHQQTEYFNGMNKDNVRVDKDGNGLSRLWNQGLTMFPLARLETAEAITAVYPTPALLFEAYDNCKSNEERSLLLQDITVRRAAGPLSANRHIGPALSKKVYNFFCSEQNILL